MVSLLAHGALGAFDELIFVGVAVIFLVMMGISWIRSRSTPVQPPEATPATPTESAADDAHFPLE